MSSAVVAARVSSDDVQRATREDVAIHIDRKRVADGGETHTNHQFVEPPHPCVTRPLWGDGVVKDEASSVSRC